MMRRPVIFTPAMDSAQPRETMPELGRGGKEPQRSSKTAESHVNGQNYQGEGVEEYMMLGEIKTRSYLPWVRMDGPRWYEEHRVWDGRENEYGGGGIVELKAHPNHAWAGSGGRGYGMHY
jgi:hypothetical protein